MARRSKHLTVGPGGVGCNCCFPAPGSKARKLEYRRAKRLDKREAMNIEQMHITGRTKAGNDIGGI